VMTGITWSGERRIGGRRPSCARTGTPLFHDQISQDFRGEGQILLYEESLVLDWDNLDAMSYYSVGKNSIRWKSLRHWLLLGNSGGGCLDRDL
jgi:hypothetical protein